MLDALVKQLGVSEDALKKEIKEVHERHNTSEYSFLLQEMPSVKARLGEGTDINSTFSNVIDAYKNGRKNAEALYSGVIPTLKKISSCGTLIVGFTESQFFYTTQRIRALGLDGLIQILYTTQDRGLPPLDELVVMKNRPPSFYDLRLTRTSRLPHDALKPDPELLCMILNDIKANSSDAIYVGDNLFKDISMATAAGVRSVHAAYGEAHDDPRYELLREVTHWKAKAVKSEQTAKNDGITPDFVLKKSFEELLEIFQFTQFTPI